MMAIQHKKLHREVVERLSLTPEDHVLEIGFGAGTAVEMAARSAAFVGGIDPSPEMVRLAGSRNRAALKSGRAQLLRASAAALPFPGQRFSVVFEVHSFNHWDGKEKGLKEIFRVLKPGGRLLMALRKRSSASMDRDIGDLSERLIQCGFGDVASECHQFGHGGAFVTARRPARLSNCLRSETSNESRALENRQR